MKLQANILSQAYYKPSGASLLVMMQNKDMPILDLFVREVIQNSMDAANPKKHVKVDILTGSFSNFKLANKFDRIDEVLKNRYGNNDCTYIAVRDFNTKGLTGDKDGNPENMDETQNLAKLVYHIMRAQPIKGSGGSTGIGKTIYYRIGNGLVIYYTRVKLSNNAYEERLVASLIEDEKDPRSILNKTRVNNSGIALFGLLQDDKTIVIDNPIFIKDLLSIFNIKPYSDQETGTTILIPYTNEQKLLKHNLLEENNNSHIYWNKSIDKFLQMAIIRWYFPRMSKKYPGSQLSAFINGLEIKIDDKKPIFKHLENMYFNFMNKSNTSSDKFAKIKGPKYVDRSLGFFLYKILNDEDLKLNPPYNYPYPHEFLGLSKPSNSSNKPIILYTRKPGMIISYETGNGWNNGNITLPAGKNFFGIFILNSNACIDGEENSLEEYIRHSEKSDHTSWVDHNHGGERKRQIVSNIKSEISKLIKTEIEGESKQIQELSPNAYFGKKYAELLLPSNRFGKGSSYQTKDVKKSDKKNRRKKTSIKIEGTQLDGDKLVVDFLIENYKSRQEILIQPNIHTSESNYSISNWFNYGFDIPITLNSYSVKIENYNNKKYLDNVKDLNIENRLKIFIESIDNTNVGIKIINQDFNDLNLRVFLEFTIKNNSYEINFKPLIKECE